MDGPRPLASEKGKNWGLPLHLPSVRVSAHRCSPAVIDKPVGTQGAVTSTATIFWSTIFWPAEPISAEMPGSLHVPRVGPVTGVGLLGLVIPSRALSPGESFSAVIAPSRIFMAVTEPARICPLPTLLLGSRVAA